jgi:hypothetical protein
MQVIESGKDASTRPSGDIAWRFWTVRGNVNHNPLLHKRLQNGFRGFENR